MDNNYLNSVLQKARSKQMRRRVMALLAAVVLLFTSNQLKFYADTLERSPTCGLEEHLHTETCFDEAGNLVCGLVEHAHTDACYQERPHSEAELPAEDVEASYVEEPVEELGDFELEAPEEAGLVSESYEAEEGIACDVAEAPVYDFDGASYALLSDILANTGLDISENDIDEVGESVVDDQQLSIAISKNDGDYTITAVRDFVDDDPVELAVFTKDGEIYLINLKNGIEPETAIADESDVEPEVVSDVSVDDVKDDVVELTEEMAVEEDAVEFAEEPSVEEAIVELTEAELSFADDEPHDAAERQDNEKDEAADEELTGEENQAEEEQTIEENRDVDVDADYEENEDAVSDESIKERDSEAEEEKDAEEAQETDAESATDAEEDNGTEKDTESEVNSEEGKDAEAAEHEIDTESVTEAEEEQDSEALDVEIEEQTDETAAKLTLAATIELNDSTAPFSLNWMMAEAAVQATEALVEAQPAEENVEESTEEVTETDSMTPADWTLEYNEALFDIEFTGDDYLITPNMSFETATICVEAGDSYVLSLVNYKMPISCPAQRFEGQTATMTVRVSADEGAFPEGTTMEVVDIEDEATISDIAGAVENEDTMVNRVHAVDITFHDAERNEIEPQLPISVVMTVNELTQSADAVVVHMDDAGNAETIEQTETADASEVAFDAETFSVYAVVVTERYITANGESWNIQVSYNSEAGIPEGASLKVSEVDASEYLDMASEAMGADKSVKLARFFDITILADGQEIQPDGAVTVKVALDDAVEADEVKAVHFAEDDVDVLKAEDADGVVTFSAESFSVYGIVYTVVLEYENRHVELLGNEETTLSALLTTLDSGVAIDEVTRVEHTGEAIALEAIEGDWRLRVLPNGNGSAVLTVETAMRKLDIAVTLTGHEDLDLGNAVISAANGLYLPETAEGYSRESEDVAAAVSAVESSLEESLTQAETALLNREYRVYDIGLDNVDPEDYPDGFVVRVTLEDAPMADNLRLFHIHDGAVSEIEDFSVEDGVLTFTTDNFSEFVLYGYDDNTHDFNWDDDDTVSLKALLVSLGLESKGMPGDMTVSDPQLLGVTPVADEDDNITDWRIEKRGSLEKEYLYLHYGEEQVTLTIEDGRVSVHKVYSLDEKEEYAVRLSALLRDLGISGENIANVRFSNESLLRVRRIENEAGTVDWLLQKLANFASQEYLTIEYADDSQITLSVKDDQVTVINDEVSIKILDGWTRKEGDVYVWEADQYPAGHDYTFRVNYSFSTDTVYKTQWEPGQIEIRLPRTALVDRNGNAADGFHISLPADDDPTLTAKNVFAYRVEGDDIVVYNRMPAAPAQVGYFEISYTTDSTTFDYADFGTGKDDHSKDIDVTLTIFGEDDDGNVYRENVHAEKHGGPIVVAMDTTAEVTRTEKRDPKKYESWQSNWGTEPEDMEGKSSAADEDASYIYLVWTVKSELEATQPFDFRLEDTFDVPYGEVVGYRLAEHPLYSAETSEYKGHPTWFIPAFENGNVINDMVLPMGKATRTDYVLTRIEKEYYFDYLLSEQQSFIVNNTVRASVTPADGVDDATYATGAAPYTDKRSSFHVGGGGFGNDKKGLTTSQALTRFSESDSATGTLFGLRYSAWMEGSTYPYTYAFTPSEDVPIDPGADTEAGLAYYGQKPVTFTLSDNKLWMEYFDFAAYVTEMGEGADIESGAEDEYTKKTDQLTKDDYRIDSVEFVCTFRDAAYSEISKEVYAGSNLTAAQVIEYAAAGRIGKLVFTIENDSAAVDGTITYDFEKQTFTGEDDAADYLDAAASGAGQLVFKSGKNITGFTMSNENTLYYTKLEARPSVTLKRGGEIVGAVLDAVKDNAERGASYQFKLWNEADYTVTQDEKTLYNQSHDGVDNVLGDTGASEIIKNYTTRRNDTVNNRYLVGWHIVMDETYTASGIDYPVEQSEGGVFYDLLPLSAEYLGGTLTVTADGRQLNASQYSLSVVSNYNSTGRALMQVEVFWPAEVYELDYTTAFSWDSILEQRSNSTIVQAHNAVSYTKNGDAGIGKFVKDKADFTAEDSANLDPLATKGSTISTSYDCPVTALVSGTLGLQKLVRATEGEQYGKEAETISGSEYSYLLRFGPNAGTKARDLVVFDFLETYPGTQWTGALKSVDTSLAVAMGAEPVVYYSTIPRDIFINGNVRNKDDGAPITDYQTLAEAGLEGAEYFDGDVWVDVWFSTPPANLSDVTAVAVDLRNGNSEGEEGHFVLRDGKTVSVTIYMEAPTGEVTDENREVIQQAQAYNSMYLQNETVDESTRFTNDPDVRLEEHTQVTIKLIGNLKLHKVNADSVTEPVKGVDFRLTGVSAYGTEVDLEATSDSNGAVNFKNLELTDPDNPYRLWEVGGNPDYQVDGTVYLVSVNADGSITLSTESGEALPESITKLNEGDYQYQVTNKPRAHGDLSFTKKGKVDGITDLKELEGASFSLTSDPVSDYNNFIEMFAVSDHEGVVTFENVEKGRYILAEIAAAEGYALANRTFVVIVDGDGVVSMEMNGAAEDDDNVVFEMIETSAEGAAYKEYAYELTDEPLHDLGLFKVDAQDNTQLEGAVFQLAGTSDNDNYVEVTATSDSAGMVRFDGLEPGTYSMRETVAPYRTVDGVVINYVVDPTVYGVEIERDGRITITYTDAEGSEQTMTNVVEVDGEQKIIALGVNPVDYEGTDGPSSRFFQSNLASFHIPNEPDPSGRLTVEKIWLDVNGYELKNITSRPVPEVYISTENPIKSVSAALIDRNKWVNYKNSIKISSVTDVQKYDNAHKPTNAETAESEGWTKISVDNDDDYPDNIYVKLDSEVLYFWSDSANVFLPENCEQMFCNFANMVSFDSSIFRAEKVTSMEQMFRYCRKLTTANIEKWNLTGVSNFVEMFSDCDKLTSAGDNIFVSCDKDIDFSNMFDLGTSLQKCRIVNVSPSGGGTVKLHCMFRRQWTLQTVQFVNFMNVQAHNDMQDFLSPYNETDMDIKSVDLGGLRTDNVTDMKNLFYRCVDLEYVDLTSFDTHNVRSNINTNMFKSCKITVLVDPDKWTLNASSIFPNTDCSLAYGTYTKTFTPVHYPAVTSTKTLSADPTAVTLVTDSASPVLDGSAMSDEQRAGIYDQWIYDSVTGHWTYNFRVVPKSSQTYAVWESNTDNMSDWTWVEGESSDFITYVYRYSDETGRATVRNRKKTEDILPEDGDLIVGKKVTGDTLGTHANDTFTFKVLVDDVVQQVNGSETFTLKSGQTMGFYNLSADAEYKVVEVGANGFGVPKVNSAEMTKDGDDYFTTGTIVANAQVFVQVENPVVPTTGDLKITKEAIPDEGVTDLDPEALYEFTVKLWTESDVDGEIIKTPLTGSGYGLALNAQGEAVKRIKTGESIELTNLPEGAKYTVTETPLENYESAFVRTVDGTVSADESWTITAGSEDVVAYTNTKTQNDSSGGFTLIKALGANTETTDAFTFLVVLGGLVEKKPYSYRVTDTKGTEDTGDDTYVDYPFTSGADGSYTATLRLTPAQRADFGKLPVGATYRITESAAINFIASYGLENSRDEDGNVIGIIAQTSGRNTEANKPLPTATETVEKDELTTVTFTNTEAMQSVKVVKKDATDEAALTGAVLGIFRVTVQEGQYVETLVGAENLVTTLTSASMAVSRTLRSGSYILRELTPPTGYRTAKDIRFDLSDTGVLRYWSVDTVKDEENITYALVSGGSVTEGQAKSLEIEMLDEPATITVMKQDESGQPISGAMLAIFTAEENSLVDMWTTDATGSYDLTGKLRLDGQVTDAGEATGTKYILREVNAPAAYLVADDIYFVLCEENEAIAIYSSGTADGHYEKLVDEEDEPVLTLVMTDKLTEFTFSKQWREMEGTEIIPWPESMSITVDILQATSASDEDPAVIGTYIIAHSDLTVGQEIAAALDDGIKLKVVSVNGNIYTFSINGLPRYGANGEQYIYYVSEKMPAGGQPPKYYETVDAETEATGAPRIGDKGMILNRESGGYELPSTGGPGTTAFTISGTALVLLALVLLLRKKREGEHD